ncbi:hypothetical protein F5Y14DRAFT_461762 [Nemania sp. NC0429]|nr:hypothetical protein F5Y14DRAFT_461762 [Nemania sp. NC0429]
MASKRKAPGDVDKASSVASKKRAGLIRFTNHAEATAGAKSCGPASSPNKHEDIEGDTTLPGDIDQRLAIPEDLLPRQPGTLIDMRTFCDAIQFTANERDEAVSELRATQTQLKSVKEQNEQLIQDIVRISGVRMNALDLDDTIKTQFMDLRETVRLFTRSFCNDQISPRSLPHCVREQFQLLTEIPYTKLLKSRLHARYFVEGLIWRILYGFILMSPFGIWGEEREIASLISDVMRPPCAAVDQQLWRVSTGQLFTERLPIRAAKIDFFRKALIDYIKPLVSDEDKANIKEKIETVLDETIALAKNLAQSRTTMEIQVREPGTHVLTGGQEYNENWMEIIEKSISHYSDIDFIVTPALIQGTNSRGEVFKRPRVIVKAEVCYARGPGSSADPKPNPSFDEQNQISMTESGRRVRSTRVLGQAANEVEVDKAIGDGTAEIDDSKEDSSEYESAKDGEGSQDDDD